MSKLKDLQELEELMEKEMLVRSNQRDLRALRKRAERLIKEIGLNERKDDNVQ